MSEPRAVCGAICERSTSQVWDGTEAAREKTAQEPGDDSCDAVRRLLMGKGVIRFFVERERDRVDGIGALGLPGAYTGVAGLAVV